jgi:hypothetical protein
MTVAKSLDGDEFSENYCPYCGQKLIWPEQQEEAEKKKCGNCKSFDVCSIVKFGHGKLPNDDACNDYEQQEDPKEEPKEEECTLCCGTGVLSPVLQCICSAKKVGG